LGDGLVLTINVLSALWAGERVTQTELSLFHVLFAKV
jgi:hypothetical protein